GRDWWIAVANKFNNKLHKILLNPTGLIHFPSQDAIFRNGAGMSVFSPNGKWFALFNTFANPDGTAIDLFSFDRCTGVFSDHVHLHVDTTINFGTIAFSNNSRFLYASVWENVFQFDLSSASILDSRINVAHYDGFTDSLGRHTRFYSMRLGPNHKIYISTREVTNYLHVINYPDSLGVSCNVQQHAIQLPSDGSYTLPNIVNHDLGVMLGSPCDSILNTTENYSMDAKDVVQIDPNPADNSIMVSANNFIYSSNDKINILIRSVSGQEIKRFQLSPDSLPFVLDIGDVQKGVYFVSIQYGKKISSIRRIIILER
ncbi:MAG: T9SS type A sorting domain-containing protein, partial [Culicoidibacterales bacterium]